MPKRTPPVEWYIAESDAEWQRLCAPDTPDPSLAAQWLLGGGALLLCLLAGVWWWRTDQATLSPAKAEVTATAQQELGDGVPGRDPLVARHIDQQSTADRRHQGGREINELSAASEIATSSASVFDAVQTFEVQGDLAVARVVMYTEHGEPAYRQTRFYLHMPTGWIRTDPDATLWGAARSLETPSFVFRFHQHDAPRWSLRLRHRWTPSIPPCSIISACLSNLMQKSWSLR